MSIFIASCVCALVPIFHLLHSFETFIKLSFPSFFCVSVLSCFNGMIMFYIKEYSVYGYVKIRNLFTCAFLHPFSKYLVHHLPLSLSSVFSNHFYKNKVLFQHIGYKLEGAKCNMTKLCEVKKAGIYFCLVRIDNYYSQKELLF